MNLPNPSAFRSCLVPRRLSENVPAKEGGKDTPPAVCTLPMVPCGSSPVTRFALASAMRKTKRLRRRLIQEIAKRTGCLTDEQIYKIMRTMAQWGI